MGWNIVTYSPLFAYLSRYCSLEMAPIAKNKAAATSRSRNTTPMSGASSTEPGSATTSAPATVMSYAEIGELCRSTATPTSTILKKLLDGMKQRSDIAKSRSSHHDMSFRDASKRKDKELDKQHELEVARSREEEELKAKAKARSRSPIVKEQDDDGDVEMQMDDEQRPPAVGARGVARQDGVPSEGWSSPSLFVHLLLFVSGFVRQFSFLHRENLILNQLRWVSWMRTTHASHSCRKISLQEKRALQTAQNVI